MNLEDIQPWIVNLLEANPDLFGVVILADDGSYPKTPQRERALKEVGLVIIVWPIESGGLTDESPSGHGVELINVAIVIEENLAVCRSVNGIGIRSEKALRLVRTAVLGKRSNQNSSIRIRSANPPFKNFGTQNGLHRIVLELSIQVPLLA